MLPYSSPIQPWNGPPIACNPAGPYLHAYAGEAAWREDNRRVDNGAQTARVGVSAMASRVSRQWKGYWQREG